MTLYPPPGEIIQRAFPGISEQEAAELARKGAVCEYPASTVLCHEDALEDTFYILLEGEVQVTKSIDASEVRVLKQLWPGDFFGEMALINNAPRAANVVTVVPSRVLEIYREAFNRLLQQNASVSLAMVREVSRRLRQNDALAIGDLRVKARELAGAYQQLAEVDYARREFLTTIAHEMRTPLTAANGFLHMIRTGMVRGEALNSALETVDRHLQEITSRVNDLLFLQEMDQIQVEFHTADLGAIVASAMEKYRSLARRNLVGMKLTVTPGLPAIRADAQGLERAITALLDNAIKFSPDGGDVEVEIGVGTDGGGADQVIVFVRDHGVGIPEQALPHIFKRFYRIEDMGGHLFRGLGLGLSIAKQVVEQHGGRIEVESQVGQGSTFRVFLNTTITR
jgi:signal transduction histidine kinase